MSRNDAVAGELNNEDSKLFNDEDLDEGVVIESKVALPMSNYLVLEKKGKINLSDTH